MLKLQEAKENLYVALALWFFFWGFAFRQGAVVIFGADIAEFMSIFGMLIAGLSVVVNWRRYKIQHQQAKQRHEDMLEHERINNEYVMAAIDAKAKDTNA